MWNIIILSSLLVAVPAADIEDVYGDWVVAAFYPVSTYIPMCFHMNFEKTLEDVACKCPDDKTPKLMTFSKVINGTKGDSKIYPVLAVDTPNEAAVNVACKCGDKDYPRIIARKIDKDYLLISTKEHQKTKTFLFSKEVVSAATLQDVMNRTEVNETGAMMCSTEVEKWQVNY